MKSAWLANLICIFRHHRLSYEAEDIMIEEGVVYTTCERCNFPLVGTLDSKDSKYYYISEDG